MAVDAYMPEAFNVKAALRPFFEHPASFRQLQASLGTLISGSFALKFLSRSTWECNDLDLYTWVDSWNEVYGWLILRGYGLIGGPLQELEAEELEAELLREQGEPHVYPRSAIHNVFNFEKFIGTNIMRIQVVVAETSPIAPILQFHSSTYTHYPVQTAR